MMTRSTRNSSSRQASLAATAKKPALELDERKAGIETKPSAKKRVLKVKAENSNSPNQSGSTDQPKMVTIRSGKNAMGERASVKIVDLDAEGEAENSTGPSPVKSLKKETRSLKKSDILSLHQPLSFKTEQDSESPVVSPVKSKQNLLEHDSEDEDEVDGENNDSLNYLKLREQNLRANEEFFAKLGIESAKLQMQASAAGPKKSGPSQRGLKIKREPAEPLPRRQSMRIRRVDPLGVPLPPLPEPISEPVEERLPSGPLVMKDHIFSKADNVTEENLKVFAGQIFSLKEEKQNVSCDLKTLVSQLDKVKITEDRVAKVVPGRVFSVTWHPSSAMLITAAGDKYGHVGLWNVLGNDSDGSVLAFKPHTKPVSHLLFPTAMPHKLLSCSYDATLRCGDFEKGVFDEVFSVPEEEDDLLRNFEFVDSAHTMLVSHFRGNVSVVDLRTPTASAEQVYDISNKSLRTVSVHPMNPHYFITAGVEAVIKLWDRRSMKAKSPKPVQTLANHNKSIASAYFSPNSGDKILSSSADDSIQIHSEKDSMNYELSKRIRHNNCTGRWLTNFRPEWHPVVPDVFITGSMSRPREIEVYSADGHRLKSLTNEDHLGSVCSLNSFHPQRPCTIVGANSSGRLHVFM